MDFDAALRYSSGECIRTCRLLKGRCYVYFADYAGDRNLLKIECHNRIFSSSQWSEVF